MKNKKILFSFLAVILVSVSLFFTGCGEQFIVQGDYQLVALQYIKDNTPHEWGHAEMGEILNYFYGDMTLDKCIVHVDSNELCLTFDDSETTGLKAEFLFNSYTDDSSYPAYKFQSINVYKDNELLPDPNEGNIGLSDQDAAWGVYSDIIFFYGILKQCETSIQVVTANQTLFCHIILKTSEDNELALLGQLYGYLL